MKNLRFYKTGNDWFVDLPEYIEQGGSISDLQMVDGADTMLDTMANNTNEVWLTISEERFDGADLLILIEKCDPYIGGGNYLLKDYEGMEINMTMWLCQVIEFVFSDIPEHIIVKRENPH